MSYKIESFKSQLEKSETLAKFDTLSSLKSRKPFFVKYVQTWTFIVITSKFSFISLKYHFHSDGCNLHSNKFSHEKDLLLLLFLRFFARTWCLRNCKLHSLKIFELLPSHILMVKILLSFLITNIRDQIIWSQINMFRRSIYTYLLKNLKQTTFLNWFKTHFNFYNRNTANSRNLLFCFQKRSVKAILKFRKALSSSRYQTLFLQYISSTSRKQNLTPHDID